MPLCTFSKIIFFHFFQLPCDQFRYFPFYSLVIFLYILLADGFNYRNSFVSTFFFFNRLVIVLNFAMKYFQADFPVYCGIIVVPAFKEDELTFVKGQHQNIISESLFYKVQDVLNGNARPVATKVASPDILPLRGFLRCPNCNRMLTGSASKGRSKRYYYYHCSCNTCGVRFKAEEVNRYFEKDLLKYKLLPATGNLFKMVVLDEYRSSNREELDERAMLYKKIEEQESILATARKKLMKDEIDGSDFKIVKSECNEELKKLEAQLADLPTRTENLKTIERLLEEVVKKYSNIDEHYKNADLEEKRRIIGSMYPENLCFDGTEHRTARLNEALSLILLINRTLNSTKKGKDSLNLNLSPNVVHRGIEPLFQE